jgi:hypothetical protein
VRRRRKPKHVFFDKLIGQTRFGRGKTENSESKQKEKGVEKAEILKSQSDGLICPCVDLIISQVRAGWLFVWNWEDMLGMWQYLTLKNSI